MKAQKSWDTPVADETRDVSDASEDIHGITDDITDDAESAEVDAEAFTLLRKRHRRMKLQEFTAISNRTHRTKRFAERKRNYESCCENGDRF